MAVTKLVLDRQAIARIFSFGSSAAGNDALVTIEKGTAATSTVVLDVKGSQNIGGDLNLNGNLNITGSINETAVTNLSVADLTIRTNKGGTTSGAAGAGLQVEGDSAATIGAITYAAASATKFQIGNGTTQADIADVSTAQTFTNKTIGVSQLSGAVGFVNGGTGATSQAGAINATNPHTALGDMSYRDASNVTRLAGNTTTTKQFLTQTGNGTVSAAPVWGALAAADIPAHSAALITSGILTATVGGTGSAFTQFSGPATAIKTFTLPNASASILTDNAAVTVAQGGTGVSTLPANNVLIGAGTGAVTGVAPSTSGNVLTSNGTTWVSSAPSGGAQYFHSATVTGTQDGSNKAFTIGAAVSSGSEQVFLNGQLLMPGLTNDYTISSTTVTFTAGFTAPAATDTIRIYGVF